MSNKIIEEFTREEYQLLYDSFKNYRVYMSDEQEVLSEKILDKVFYPSFDKQKTNLSVVKWKLDNTTQLNILVYPIL